MFNDLEKSKIQKFIDDKAMSDAVYKVLLLGYLQPNTSNDVHVLAANRIALDMLPLAWKELEKFKRKTDEDLESKNKNVGL